MAGRTPQPGSSRRVTPLLPPRFPNTAVAPAAKAAVGMCPIAVVGRHRTPRSACAQTPAHRLAAPSLLASVATPDALTTRQMRRQPRPTFR